MAWLFHLRNLSLIHHCIELTMPCYKSSYSENLKHLYNLFTHCLSLPQDREARKAQLRHEIPPEPDAGDPDAVRVSLKLPHGTRVERRFRKTESLKVRWCCCFFCNVFNYFYLNSIAQEGVILIFVFLISLVWLNILALAYLPFFPLINKSMDLHFS